MHICAPCLRQMRTPQAAPVLALQPLPCSTHSWPYSSRVGCEAAYDRCNYGTQLRTHAYACICAQYSATMTLRALGDSRSSPALGEMHMEGIAWSEESWLVGMRQLPQLAIAVVVGRLRIYVYICRCVHIELIQTRLPGPEINYLQHHTLHTNPHHSPGIILCTQLN